MSRSLVAARLGMTCLLAAGCAFNEITIPKTTPSIVVHAVLNPSAPTQILLLERTLTGVTTVRDSAFDPSNPIATGGGLPITGAVAEITDSTGRVVRGVEDKIAATGKGTGVYRFSFGFTLRLGGLYTLHVRTAEGEEVNASTRLPRPASTSTGALSRTFNRDHDTLYVQWNPAAGARTYVLRVESPFGPFFLFTDSTRFRMTGDVRNLFSNDLQRLFIPGFRQDVLIGAVDSNFYDYYRTQNDPFTGSGIISRIDGGLGLFGSIVTLTTGTLNVTADLNEPIEGRYRLTPASTDPAAPSTITLYVESKSTRADVPDALSGRYTTTGPIARTDGILGQQSGFRVSFAILANQLTSDTLDVFTGDYENGVLTGTYRKRVGPAVFVKQ